MKRVHFKSRDAVRALLPLAAAMFLAACTTIPPNQRSPLAEWRPSPNHDLRKAVIVVLHYTVEDTLEGSRKILSDDTRKHPVSSHYLIDRDGRILQLVPDHLRAWHAGDGRWGTIPDLNDASIGIEIVNTGSEPFPDAQVAAVIGLLDDICKRHGIPKSQVIGHGDLAPGRKIDPGVQFPWKRLADAGFGQWPQGELVDPPAGFDGWTALRVIGYDIRDKAAVLRAFRIHYRARDDGKDAVGEFQREDLRILYALTRPGS